MYTYTLTIFLMFISGTQAEPQVFTYDSKGRCEFEAEISKAAILAGYKDSAGVDVVTLCTEEHP